ASRLRSATRRARSRTGRRRRGRAGWCRPSMAPRLGNPHACSWRQPTAAPLEPPGREPLDRELAAPPPPAPASPLRPPIFSASLPAAAPEIRASRTWTGLAGSGRMALIDHRDAAEAGLRVLTDPALWGAHHDLTGPAPMSWPEALELLSAELGEPVTFQVAAEPQLLERLTGAGVPAGTAQLLITREWAILAGENDYTTGTFQQITGRPPRPVAEFLHDYRAEFL